MAWVAMVTLVYSEPSIIVWRQSWGQDARHWIPVIVIVVGLLLIFVTFLVIRRVEYCDVGCGGSHGTRPLAGLE